MTELYSRLDLYDIGRRYVITRARNINPREIDVEGSDINLFIGAVSFMAHAVARQNADRVGAQMLNSAYGDDLVRLGYDRYQLPIKGAAAAVGGVVVSRASAAAGAGTIPRDTKLITLGGVEYVTTQAINLSASGVSSLSAEANVRAVQAGKEYQVGANQIRRFDKPNLLFDSTLKVNNPEATAGGEPAESNDQYKERCHAFWLAARRGTLPAIEQGALTVPGIVSASAREYTENGREIAFIELFVADSSGTANKALADKVKAALYEYRAGGIYVRVNLSIPQIVDLIFQPTFVSGVDTVALSEQVRLAIVEYVNSLRVNEGLYRNDLGAVFARFRRDGLLPNDGTLIEPIGDLIPPQGRTLRTSLANVQVLAPLIARSGL